MTRRPAPMVLALALALLARRRGPVASPAGDGPLGRPGRPGLGDGRGPPPVRRPRDGRRASAGGGPGGRSTRVSPEAYARSVEPNRERLARIIGAIGPRVAPATLSYVSSPDSPAEGGRGGGRLGLRGPLGGLSRASRPRGCCSSRRARPGRTSWRCRTASSSPEALAGLAPGPGVGAGAPAGPAGVPGPGADPDRPDRRVLGQPAGPDDQPAASRVDLPDGLRGGPAPDRLRGRRGPRGGRLVHPAGAAEAAGRRGRPRRGGPDRAATRRRSTRGSTPPGSPAISALARGSGPSRSTATSGASWRSSATPRSPRLVAPRSLVVEACRRPRGRRPAPAPRTAATTPPRAGSAPPDRPRPSAASSTGSRAIVPEAAPPGALVFVGLGRASRATRPRRRSSKGLGIGPGPAPDGSRPSATSDPPSTPGPG